MLSSTLWDIPDDAGVVDGPVVAIVSHSHCAETGKVKHVSHAEATRQQARLPRRGKDLCAYKCMFCNAWHLGRSGR